MAFRTVLSIVSLAFVLMESATSAPFGDGTNRLTIAAIYSMPIAFYGKVVDESTNAVAGADVMISVATKPWEDGEKHRAISDAEGLFSLTGVAGAGMFVSVSKEGFLRTAKSKLMLTYYDDGARNRSPLPTSLEPAVFVLKRAQGFERMIHRRFRRFSIAGDGTPAGVSFHAKPRSGAEVPDFHAQLWRSASSTNAQGQYNWNYKFSIPGGGLADRKDVYEFQAPAEGYREVIEGEMVAGGDRWHTSVQRDFFGRLQNGCHVRFHVSLTTRGKGSFSIESFLNPAPGSRNLEFDPKMVELP